jgi:hypothetical protein
VKIFARAALVAAWAYAAYTLWLIARMFWFICYSMTSAIRVDELVMMEEIRLFCEGKYSISYLWAPYWGHRMLIPRLLMVAGERFFHFSNTPLAVASLIAQVLTTVLLVWVEWRMLRNGPRWLTIFVMAATAHLALSALQLETFLFGINVQFTEGLLGALASIVLSAVSIRSPKTQLWMPLAALSLALLGALSMGTGVFIGPVILLVSFGLRARPRVLAALALLGAAFSAAYFVGYTNPGHAMGFTGLLLHPLGAIRITALVLGGPITDHSLGWGAACGYTGLLLAAVATIRLVLGRAPLEEAALTGFCVFLALYSLAFAFARFTPQSIAALGHNTMLTSHDFTVPFLFWGTLFALVAANHRGILSKASCVAVAVIVGYLTLHTAPSQLAVSMAWLEFHRTLDVAGAGMIMGATDPEYLFELMPEQKSLDYYRPYMKQHRLSFFADDRASWPGRELKTVFGDPIGGCRGSIDRTVPAGDGKFRLEGFADGPGVKFPHERQIVLTDAAGRINGLGNTLAVSEKRGGGDFVAYADGTAAEAYLITPAGKACRVNETVSAPYSRGSVTERCYRAAHGSKPRSQNPSQTNAGKLRRG